MVDTIKIFITSERRADYNGHFSYIVNRMLDIFSAAGHHQYAKGARLYCQLMRQLSTSRRSSKVSRAVETMLSVTPVMIDMAPGVTSV